MGKRTTKSRAARARKAPVRKARPSKSKAPRPVARRAKPAPPKKTAARKPKPSARKAKPPAPRRRARPAATPPSRGKKAARKARAPQTTEQVAAKRSHAVKKLLALKAEKVEPAPRKDGFLIKAPKKAKQENLAAVPRFVRRPAAPKPVEPEKAAPPPRKVVLRKKDVDELHEALDAEQQRLIAQLNALDEVASLTGPSEVNENVPGYSIHPAEYASENQVIETTLAQRVLQTERLAEIEDALRRISHPGFGICRNCGNPIGLERLKVKPSAEFCVPCRQLKEQGRI